LKRGNRPARIIICDDEPYVREVMSLTIPWIFTDLAVTLCSDGNETWQRISQRPPDLLITDLRHPGMQLEEMLHRLYRHPKRFPVIVCSACLGARGIRSRLKSFTMFPVLLMDKPWKFECFRAQLHCAFDLPAPTGRLF
jgi:CheY-like chemotaxis protein